MGDANNTTALVFDINNQAQVAKIILNGYNIAAGGPLGKTGAMRSFKVVEGDLRDHWYLGARLKVQADDGRSAFIKIAAHPAEEGAMGFVEFLT